MNRRQIRQRLIREFYPSILRIAKRMVKRYPASVELDDLVSIGTIAFIEAIDRHDPQNMSEFATYANLRVRGAIVDAMRTADWVPRSVRQRHRDLISTRQKLKTQFSREPTIAEIAEDLAVSVERVKVLYRDARIYTLVSTDDKLRGSTQSVIDKISSQREDPEEVAERQSIATAVRLAVHSLDPRERSLIQFYYFDGMSFAEIAVLLGLTESRISQLHTKIKATLAKRISITG